MPPTSSPFPHDGGDIVANESEERTLLMIFARPVTREAALAQKLLAFAFSCWRVKPSAATVGALAILVADELVRVQPGLASLGPWTLGTRIRTWRAVFAYDVPRLRIERNLTDLVLIDLVLVAFAWWSFRRREL